MQEKLYKNPECILLASGCLHAWKMKYPPCSRLCAIKVYAITWYKGKGFLPTMERPPPSPLKLIFINLGGYKEQEFGPASVVLV